MRSPGGADKRREDYTKPPDTFTAEQILALARAAREGRHMNGGRRWASKENDVEQELANKQDAAIFTVAGFTGLRQGELRALRWKHVRFADRTIVIVAGMSAGEESSTKSGKVAGRAAGARGVCRPRRAQPPRLVHEPRRLRVLRPGRRPARRLRASPRTR